MSDQKQRDYERIEKAIHFINSNFKDQPSLEEIAAAVHVSPYHFQRMFSEWAGCLLMAILRRKSATPNPPARSARRLAVTRLPSSFPAIA